MFYTEHQEWLPILNDKEEMNSLGSYHSLIFCHVFLLKMLQLHNGKKFKNPETREHCGSCVSKAYVISMNNWMRLLKNCWGAKGKQTTITTLQGGHYEWTETFFTNSRKLVCGDTSGDTSALWVRRFLLYLVQQYPHRTKISLHGYFLVINVNMH